MKPTERFTNRAEDYAKWRPGYPEDVVEVLRLKPGAVVADVGAGTGISAELFARRGFDVIAIEPNAAMRAAARVPMVEGTGERTGLADRSVDAVVCAQAFHWLDAEEAKAEFLRIVKPGGAIAILWNDRLEETDGLARGLAALLAGRDRVGHRANIAKLFSGHPVEKHVFRHAQVLDWEGLLGRLRSASYVPLDDDGFFAELRALYEREQHEGRVAIHYDCTVYAVRP